MKIRGSFAIFFIGVATLLPLRLAFLSERLPQDGKWGIFFTVAVIASILLILYNSFFAKNVSSYVKIRKNLLCSISSAVMAGFVGYDSVVTLIGEYPDIFIGKQSIIYGLFGIGAAVMMFVFALSFASGSPAASKVPVLTLLPAIWAGLRLTFMFMKYTTIADISEYYFDICYFISFMLFCFGQAKIFSSIETAKAVKLTVGSGLCAALFALLSSCSRYVDTLIFNADSYTGMLTPKAMDIFSVIYILCYLFFVTAGKHHAHSYDHIPKEYIAISSAPLTRRQALDAVSPKKGGFWDEKDNTAQTAPPQSGAIKNSAKNISSSTGVSVTPTPYMFSDGKQLQPIYVISPEALGISDDYFDDEGEVSVRSGKRPSRAKGSLAPRDNRVYVIKNKPAEGAPKAHISEQDGTAASEPVVIPTVEANIEQEIMVSPDEEAASPKNNTQNSAHPHLGRGYLPKSSVESSEDGYKVYNSSDE